MPAAAGAVVVSALASGAVAAAVGGSFVAAFAGSMILGAVSYALSPKPKKPNVDISGSNVAVRQADLTRQIVYGHTRVTRGYAHMQSTGLNGTLNMILILCEGPLRAINEIWVNDYCIPPDWIDANGNITQGRYAGHMRIYKHLGEDNQGVDTYAKAAMNVWTDDHRLQGVAYLFIRMFKDQDVYPNGIPNFTAIVEGPELYDPREGGNSWSTNIALYSRDFITNNRYGFGAFDDDIDDVNVAAQANICDEIVEVDPVYMTYVGVNTATDIISVQGDMLQWQFGDRIRFSSTGTLPGGISADTDYYVIPYQLKSNPRFRIAATLEQAMAKDHIDITSAGSGTITVWKNGEPRYHGGGVLDTETPLSETLNNLVSSMAGRAVCIGGYWSLLAGAWRAPSLTLGIGDIRGTGINFKNSLTMAESFNEVKGLFISQENFYQPTDYPSAVYQQFIEQDNDLLSTKELNLPYTTRHTTAQRIAKIELFRGRQDIAVQGIFSTKALQLQPGDTVNLSIEKFGWNPKVFEVTEFTFDINDNTLVTRLALRETAQAIYDWTNGEAIDFDPAPNTELPNPYNVQVPTGVNYNSRVAETVDSDELYVMQMQWDQHPDAFVQQYGDFELQFKKSSDIEWLPSFFVDGILTQSDLFTASVGQPYDLRIRARNNLGVRSNWVTLLGAVVGSSGGVGATEDWETFSDPVVYFEDWETFSDPVGSGNFEDWGYFT